MFVYWVIYCDFCIYSFIATTEHIHPSIHPSSVTTLFLFYGVVGVLPEPIPAVSGRGQGKCWISRQLLLMAEAAMQGANHTSGAIWGSVPCSRTLQHALPAELQTPQKICPKDFNSMSFPTMRRHPVSGELFISVIPTFIKSANIPRLDDQNMVHNKSWSVALHASLRPGVLILPVAFAAWSEMKHFWATRSS